MMGRRTLSKRRHDGQPAKGERVGPGLPASVLGNSSGPSQWTGFLLHRAHQAAKVLYETHLAELSLQPHQVGILQLLASNGPMVQARLGDKLQIDKATIVPNLNKLESSGLVVRRTHHEDNRAFVVYLLPAGLQMLKRAEKVNRLVSGRLLAALSTAEKEQLHLLLSKLVSSQPTSDKTVTHGSSALRHNQA